MEKKHYKTMDEYIADFPEDVQKTLRQLRQTIRKAAPGAEETISYQMPTFKFHGSLVHFAVFKNHYGLYPTPSVMGAFEKELAPYIVSKGAIRFPKDKPIPYDLVAKIVQYRVKENLEKKKRKKG
jgi:uncharacterized protein YdhG (YjbR/CyaY superfamily)